MKIFKDYGLLAVGMRGYFGEDKLFVHFGTVPVLYLSACLFFKDFMKNKELKTLLIVVLMFVTMVISSSRALVIGFILGIVALVIIKTKRYTKLFTINMALCIIILASAYIGFNSDVFSADEVSNTVKIGHAHSFIDNISLQNALLGDGLAVYYYSQGYNRYTAHTEITVLDMTRYFGFILAFILYLSLIFPVLKLNSYKGAGAEALILFLIYIAVSLTNPVFINSLGSLIILWYWSVIIKLGRFENE